MKLARTLIAIGSSSALLFVTSCRAQKDSPAVNSPSPDTVVSATPPFQTKEPERYRATRTLTSVTADGKATVTKYSLAKDGLLRRTDCEVGSRRAILLQLPESSFVLLPDEKIYADEEGVQVPQLPDEEGNSPELLLHSDAVRSSYQKLGTESISGRNTEKYRVVVNVALSTVVSSSETLIWIDSALGMPIRSETKLSDGSSVTMEVSEISLEVDKGLFQIPNDYKKITVAELLKYIAGR